MRSGAVPARRSTLIGRARDLAAIRDLTLHSDGRLVTLAGVGGVGKTTLALEVARTLGSGMADGVRLVDLAGVPAETDRERLLAPWLQALGLADQARPPLDVLIDHLQPRQLLLVLDSCEHVAQAAGELVDLVLDACPYVRVIATSRTPLKVRGETLFAVDPLAVPDAATDSPARLQAVPSAELFLARARAADPAFAIDASNAGAISAICRRLDGLPLAIELAAAQVRRLGPGDIEQRLRTDDRLLRGDSIGVPDRQQTIEATVEWSYRLLQPHEQALFRQLSVFAGSWTLDAAQTICSGGGPDEAATTIEGDIAALEAHSLIVRERGAKPARFRFLQPVRDVAERWLDAEEGRGEIGVRHAQYFLALAGHRDEGAQFPTAPQLDRIAAEHANLLAAIRFATAAGIVPLALGLILAATNLWRIRGHLLEGLPHLERALELVGPEPTFMREATLVVLADFERLLGRYEASLAYAAAALEVATGINDAVGIRTSLAVQGDVATARGDFATARAKYEEARPYLEIRGTPIATGFWHANLGDIELRDGRLAEAETHLEAARAVLATTLPSWYTGRVLCWLGAVNRRRGRLAPAREHLTAGLDDLVSYGARLDAILGVEELGALALDERNPPLAATLLGAAAGLRDAMALPPDDSTRAALADEVERARAALPQSVFVDAWSAGRPMTLENVVALVHSAPATTPAPATAPAMRGDGRRAPRGSQLTRREREVAELVADGLTNPQIAERLFVSAGTVRGHVEQILGKLGLTSRVQVAIWIVSDRDGPREPSHTDS